MRLILSIILIFTLTVPILRPVLALAEDKAAEKSSLEQQLWAIEQEINAYQKELTNATSQKKTLTNKIEELKKRRAKLELQQKATSIKLSTTERQLGYAIDGIKASQQKLDATQKEIAEVLRQINRADFMSALKIFLSSRNLSEFFLNLEQIFALKSRLDDLANQERELLELMNQKKDELESKKSDFKDLLTIQKLEAQDILNLKKERETLLQITKGKESEYQKIVSESKKKATEIRNRLYEMAAVKAITFGEAVKIAQWVTKQIKIRPALLLSVITQESNLGKNVGTCNRPGDPPEKSWKVVMKPERDQEPFLAITKELGLDPDVQPVSCPMKDKNGKQIGWGGALGPAQFIPSTWQGYKQRVQNFTGQSIANPWDVRDAFVASALLLAANGATVQTKDSEWKAAMIYFSGSTNKKYSFYGDSVVERADSYEEDIKSLTE